MGCLKKMGRDDKEALVVVHGSSKENLQVGHCEMVETGHMGEKWQILVIEEETIDDNCKVSF